jgi:hypothetical protein
MCMFLDGGEFWRGCPLGNVHIPGGPGTETSSIYCAQLSRFHFKTENGIQSPKGLILNKIMDNV